MNEPRLSVIIPSYNGRRLLEACLSSLFRHRPTAFEFEVIVSDDASTDETAAWLARAYPEVIHLRQERNGGFVAAANAGIAASRGAFIQLLNNDAEVTAGWAEAGLKPFCDPQVGSVAPLVLMRGDPSRVDSAGDQFALFGWPSKRGHGQSADRWARHPSGPVFGASASSAFYRRTALERAGAFDLTFGSYYEDVDLAFRLRWAGYICVYAPACRILHDVSASYDHARPELQRRMARNAELLFWSNLPAPWLLTACLPHLGFVAIQAMTRSAQGRLRPFLAGKREAARLLRRDLVVRRKRRAELAHAAAARPHFPMQVLALGDLGRHLRNRSRVDVPTDSASPAQSCG